MAGRRTRWTPWRRLARWVPDTQRLLASRWLRWLGPRLHHPRLWHVNRRGIALGIGVGLFFGLLVPVAQIPLSAIAAVALRANLPTAVASTLVTNPITFAPVYVFAYHVGAAILGVDVPPGLDAAAEAQTELPLALADTGLAGWLAGWWARLAGAGKPLVVGLAVLACVGGLLGYLVVSWGWRARTVALRRSRRRGGARAARAKTADGLSGAASPGDPDERGG